MKSTAAVAGLMAVLLVGILLIRPPVAPASPAAPSEAVDPVMPVTPDYYPLNSRTIKLPIKYEKDRKAIRQVKLFVARNGENTWYQEAAVPPDRESFTFFAKEDGIYWFTMVEEDMQGRNIPADLTRTAPDLKVLVDTVPPRVQFTNAMRTGEEIVVEWSVEDKNPSENNTKVHFRPAGSDAYWQEVTLPAGSKSGVRFAAGTTSAVAVRVTVADAAGNTSESTREIAATGTTTTSLSGPPVAPAGGSGAPIPPPESLAPVSPLGSPPPGTGTGSTVTPVSPKTGGNTPAAHVPTTGTGAGAIAVQPDSRTPVLPVTPQGGSPAPVAVWSGGPAASAPASAAPTVEMTRAQIINYLSFEVGYDVESRGPSGISRIDLWVTRDDNRTWQKWSQHDAKGSTIRVNLNVPANPHPEGTYGFRVVPVSGAGLSEKEPGPGDAPELRVVVDVTAPQLDLFPPVGDPTSPDVLVIQWKASDKNFGDDPITIEWGEKPTGPWQPVAGGEGVQLATAGAPQLRRLPNTGSHAWRVPSGLPARVYLRLTARDSAGNEKTVVTRDPILVDLVKPRAKINGIVTPPAGVRQ